MTSLQLINERLKRQFNEISSFKSAIAFIRGPYTEAIQEACALLPVNAELLQFFTRVLFCAVSEAMKSIDAFLAENERVEVIAAWHAVYLADAALEPYAARFMFLFEGKFVDRIAKEKIDENIVKLCPPSEKLSALINSQL